MKALILAGEYPCNQDTNPWVKKIDGETILDLTIQSIVRLSLEPSVVLGGSSADEILRHCQQIRTSDFVFDTTPTKEASPTTNLVSGIKSVNGPCFALMPEVKLPEAHIWSHLKNLAFTGDPNEQPHIFYPYLVKRSGTQPQYPLLVTRRGVKELLTLGEITRLTDSKISLSATNFDEAPIDKAV